MATAMLTGWLYIFACCITAGMCGRCPTGWLLEKNSCYIFGLGLASWGNGQATCKLYGGKLAEIETEAENTFLKNYARSKQADHVWIGGHDQFQDGQWEWPVIRRNLLGFQDWQPGEPNGRTGENCLELLRGYNYRWNDYPCYSNQNFICELRAADTDVSKQ